MKHLLLAMSGCIVVLLGGCAAISDREKATPAPFVRAEDGHDKAMGNVKAKPSQNTGKTEKSRSLEGQHEGGLTNTEVTTTFSAEEGRRGSKDRLIVIGTTLALHASDKAISHKRYDAYEKSLTAAKLPVPMKRDWFIANSAGYTAIKYWGVSGVMSKWMYAEVSKKMKNEISFPSELLASTLGISTDLVVAEQKEDGGIWITRVLCKKEQKNFDECSDNYAKGLFRQSDGKEIDAHLKLIEDGAQIDLTTFEKLDKKG